MKSVPYAVLLLPLNFLFTEPCILSSDPQIYTATHCRPVQVVGVEALWSFPLTLSVLLSFLPLAGSLLFSPTAVISYHCKSSHHFLFRFQVPSPSFLSLLHLSLASLLMFHLVSFHYLFCCHLPWYFSSALWFADMSVLYISYFH